MNNEKPVKSNLPWMMGIIGAALALPQLLCNIICVAGFSDEMDSETGGMILILTFFQVLIAGACCTLGFFGKRDFSLMAGIIGTSLAGVDILLSFIPFNFFGLCAGGCFLTSGIFSILNAKRPAA